uniref:Uncharacterized protein n=1 Tax=Romanomermis culicivorax TaxID=13658 RepID=A0A915KQZ5_ROMCU
MYHYSFLDGLGSYCNKGCSYEVDGKAAWCSLFVVGAIWCVPPWCCIGIGRGGYPGKGCTLMVQGVPMVMVGYGHQNM